MNIGDRVHDDYLGDGEIVDDFDKRVADSFMVKFDTTPPTRYNMGENPTFIFRSSLKLLEGPKV